MARRGKKAEIEKTVDEAIATNEQQVPAAEPAPAPAPAAAPAAAAAAAAASEAVSSPAADTAAAVSSAPVSPTTAADAPLGEMKDAWTPPAYDNMDAAQFASMLASTRFLVQQQLKRDFDKSVAEEQHEQARNTIEGFTDGAEGGRSYTYMLTRAFKHIAQPTNHNASLSAPSLAREGTKKTVFNNFGTVCDDIGRTPEDVRDYLNKVMSMDSSLDASSCLVMKMTGIKVSQIESHLGKFIQLYVQCKECKGMDTQKGFDTTHHMPTIICQKCGATAFATAQKEASYKAQTTKRRLNKESKKTML